MLYFAIVEFFIEGDKLKAQELKEYLSNDFSKIEKVLESIGCHKIWQSSRDEVRCAPPEGDNKTSISVKMEGLSVRHYSKGIEMSGDIFTLIEHLKGYNFTEAIRYVKSLFGIGNSRGGVAVQAENPLAILKKHKSRRNFLSLEEIEVEEFPSTIVNRYVRLPHHELVKEGIMPQTQELFSVSYDDRMDRIVFPHFSYKSKDIVVGITGRTLATPQEMEDFDIPKYWNYIKGYKKTYNLYGFSHAIEYILKHKKVVIFEAEKSTLKCFTNNRNEGYAVSVGGHELSDVQVRILLRYTPPDTEIIIAFDKDVMTTPVKDIEGNEITGEQYIINTCKKLSKYRKTSYIFDKYDLLDIKDSPIDKGVKVYNYLEKHRIEVR